MPGHHQATAANSTHTTIKFIHITQIAIFIFDWHPKVIANQMEIDHIVSNRAPFHHLSELLRVSLG